MSAIVETAQRYRDRAFAAILRLALPYINRVRRALHPWYVQGRSRYDKLESRERVLVNIAAVVFSVFLFYNLFYSPIVDWQESLRNTVETRRRQMSEIHRLVDRYMRRKADLAQAERNTVPADKSFSLFSVVEKSFTQSVGREKIGSITPNTDRNLSDGFIQHSVDLKLQNISLSQLVDALYGVKTLPVPVAVSDIRIKRRNEDKHSYDVDLTCVALAKNG